MFTFQFCKFFNGKIDQNNNFAKLPKCQVAFFVITANFIIQSDNFGKEDTLKSFCQLETDHVTQQPKETYQTTCRGPINKGLKYNLNA